MGGCRPATCPGGLQLQWYSGADPGLTGDERAVPSQDSKSGSQQQFHIGRFHCHHSDRDIMIGRLHCNHSDRAWHGACTHCHCQPQPDSSHWQAASASEQKVTTGTPGRRARLPVCTAARHCHWRRAGRARRRLDRPAGRPGRGCRAVGRARCRPSGWPPGPGRTREWWCPHPGRPAHPAL